MKIINGRKFLEDSDMVRVGYTILSHNYGLSKYLVGYHGDKGVMTLGDYKKRRQDGTYPDDNGICRFEWVAVPYRG